MLSPQMAAGVGAGVAGVGKSIFGGNNGYDEYSKYNQMGMDQIDKYLNQAEGYLDPYRQAGQRGINGYETALNRYNDPTGYYNQIAGGYRMSDGAQFRMKTGMDAVRNALAAQGLGGSGEEARKLTDYTQGVIDQDMQKYIDQVLGVSQAGLQGYGNLMGNGLNAGTASGGYAMDAGQDLASMYSAQAQAASQNENSNSNDFWGGVGGLAAGFLL